MENARIFWSARRDMHTARKETDMSEKRESQTTAAGNGTANGSALRPLRRVPVSWPLRARRVTVIGFALRGRGGFGRSLKGKRIL